MPNAKLRQLALPAYETSAGDRSPATRAAIGRRVPATRMRLDIMSTLATGWLPWGVEWSPYITRCGNEWTLCCGHTLKFRDVSHFVTCGLLEECFDEANRQALRITPAGREWLIANWRQSTLRGLERSASRQPRASRNETALPF